MTKNMKKSLLAVLTCVLAIVACFSVFSAKSVNAAEPTAEEEFVAAVAEIKDGTEGDLDELLETDSGYYAKVADAIAKYTTHQADLMALGYKANNSGTTQGDIYEVYKAAYDVFAKAVEFEDHVRTTAKAMEIKFSNFGEYAKVIAEFDELLDEDPYATWVQKATVDGNYTLKAAWETFIANWEAMQDIKDYFDDVVDAIAGLKYAYVEDLSEGIARVDWINDANYVDYDEEDENNLFLPFDARADLGYTEYATSKVAADKLDETITDSVYSKIYIYANAIAEANDITFDMDDVFDEFDDVVEKVFEGEDSDPYTLEFFDIDFSGDVYSTSAGTSKDYNTDFIKNYNKAVKDCDAQNARIKDIIDRIDALDGIKANALGAKISEIHIKVNEIIKDLAVENTVYGAKLYWEGETLAVNGEKVNDEYFGKGDKALRCSIEKDQLLDKYQTAWAPITLEAKKVNDLIEEIADGDVTDVDVTDIEDIEAAEEALAAFKAKKFKDVDGKTLITGEQVINFITKLVDLNAARDLYDDQLDTIKDLMAQVAEINVPITVADFDAIDKAEKTFKDDVNYDLINSIISDSTAGDIDFEYNDDGDEANCYETYVKLNKLIDYRDALKADIKAVADTMDKPTIEQDLLDGGFTPKKNQKYEHTGATEDGFENGVVYFYDGEDFVEFEGENGTLDTDNYPKDIDGKKAFHDAVIAIEGGLDSSLSTIDGTYEGLEDDADIPAAFQDIYTEDDVNYVDGYTYEGAQEYLQKTYPIEYANYEKALKLDLVYNCEINIGEFAEKTSLYLNREDPDAEKQIKSEITMEDYEYIDKARDLYDAAGKDSKAQIESDKFTDSTSEDTELTYYALLQSAEKDIADALSRINRFIDLVDSIVSYDEDEEDFADVDEIISFNEMTIKEAEAVYNYLLTSDEQADDTYEYKYYTADSAYEMLQDIITRKFLVLSDYQAKSLTLVGKVESGYLDVYDLYVYYSLVNIYDILDETEGNIYVYQYTDEDTYTEPVSYNTVVKAEDLSATEVVSYDVDSQISYFEEYYTDLIEVFKAEDVIEENEISGIVAYVLKNANGSLEDAIADLQEALENAEGNAEGAIADLDAAIKALEAKLNKEITDRDAAIEEACAAVQKTAEDNVKTAIIIFSIVSVIIIACVVVLFVLFSKKK